MKNKLPTNSLHEVIAENAKDYQWFPNDPDKQHIMEAVLRMLLHDKHSHPFARQFGQTIYEELCDSAIRRLVRSAYLRTHTLLRRVIASGEVSLVAEVLTVIGRQAVHWQIREYLSEARELKMTSFDLLSNHLAAPHRPSDLELITELLASVQLSERQEHILRLIGEGYSQADIARMSRESESTVSRQVQKIAALSRPVRDIFLS